MRLSAIGVNPVEAYIRSGIYGPVPFPYTPGTDAAGVIEKIGPDITTFAPGERVYTAGSLSGTYAQFALCTPDQIHKLPDHISLSTMGALRIGRPHMAPPTAPCSSAAKLNPVKLF